MCSCPTVAVCHKVCVYGFVTRCVFMDEVGEIEDLAWPISPLARQVVYVASLSLFLSGVFVCVCVRK